MPKHKTNKQDGKPQIIFEAYSPNGSAQSTQAVRDLRKTTDKAAAAAALPKVSSMLDKLAKRHIIHVNKAANLKSKLARFVNKMA